MRCFLLLQSLSDQEHNTNDFKLNLFNLFNLFLLLGDSPGSEFYGSGNFHPKLYLYIYLSNLVPLILLAYTTYEDGTECFETSAHKFQAPVNDPKERIQHNTGLLKMIVGVLTTCHTQYT